MTTRTKKRRASPKAEKQESSERPRTPRDLKQVEPRTEHQREYLHAIENSIITVGAGPAGAGKTYLAVYEALKHHWSKEIKRIIITRPIVEAGEKLGFLPGDIKDKVDPYMRPIYDAFFDLIGISLTQEKMERGYIEIAPLAFMRGRAQPLNSLIATPTGLIPMGEVKVGIDIIGSNGCPIQVVGVFPQGKKKIFKVNFTDGSTAECSEDHLWLTQTRSEKRHSKGFSVKTTTEIVNTLKVGNNACNHEIPILSQPTEFHSYEVPVDPYLLGVLLGDGSLHQKASITITSTDGEIVEGVRQSLPPGMSVVRNGTGISYRCVPVARRGGFNPLRRVIEQLGLIGTKSFNKFIPDIYKHNSVDVRIAILQGLLDTDGSVLKHRSGRSRVQFYTTSEQLADDVRFIVQSLGGTSTKFRKNVEGLSHIQNGREIRHCRDCFTLDIRLPKGLVPFRLSRKISKFTETPIPQRLIKSIEFSRIEECQCIAVSSIDRLYVTDAFILTHNTFSNSFIILDEAQNATLEQLKMAVTRVGENCKLVINGDPLQTDLPRARKQETGLVTLQKILSGVEDVAVMSFDSGDIVRSRVVTNIIKAFERFEDSEDESMC